MPLPDIHEVLENLFRQVDNNEGDFIKEISIIRDKFIADSETIKMGLTQLLNSENDREAISSEKTIRLKEIADSILAQENSNMNDISKLQEKEKYLARLEKEIIEILSMRFKK